MYRFELEKRFKMYRFEIEKRFKMYRFKIEKNIQNVSLQFVDSIL